MRNSQEQIKELANFILEEVPGEPSQSEGAVDTAIRIIRAQKKTIDRYRQGISNHADMKDSDAGGGDEQDKRLWALLDSGYILGRLDSDGDSEPNRVSIYDHHVDGCEFTTEHGWRCQPGCPTGDSEPTP